MVYDIAETNWARINLLDLQEALIVELEVDAQNKVWLNIDGKCAVRIGQADAVKFTDRRQSATTHNRRPL